MAASPTGFPSEVEPKADRNTASKKSAAKETSHNAGRMRNSVAASCTGYSPEMGPTRKKEAAPRESTASFMWARPWKPHERNVTSLGKPPTGREKKFENSEMLFMLGARCEPSLCRSAPRGGPKGRGAP